MSSLDTTAKDLREQLIIIKEIAVSFATIALWFGYSFTCTACSKIKKLT